MAPYWKRSRVTKALADAARVGSFAEAEARLDAVRLNVVVGARSGSTPRPAGGGADGGRDGAQMLRARDACRRQTMRR